jgi:hypothetical protein
MRLRSTDTDVGQSASPPGGRIKRLVGLAERRPIAVVFVIAILARLLVAVFLGRYFSGSFVLDDQTYWDLASALATDTTARWTEYQQSLYASTVAFTLPLSFVHRTFGSEISGQLFVALLGSGAAAAVTALAKEALSRRVAILVGLIVALLPSQVLWSSLILKDASVWLALLLLAVGIARAGRAPGWHLLVAGAGIAVALLALVYLRQHTAIAACWALMLTGWVGQSAMRYHRLAGAIVLGVTIPWIAGLGPAGLTYVGQAGSIDERRAANAENAASAFAPGREDTARSQLAASSQRAEELEEQRVEIARALAKTRREEGADDRLEEQVKSLEAEVDRIAEEKGPESRRRVEELKQKKAAMAAALAARKADEQAALARLRQEKESLEAALDRIAAEEKAAAEELARIRDAEREPGVAHLARGISVMVAEPYPWDEGTSPSFRMAQAETVVWYPILVMALLGLIPALRAFRVALFPVVVGGALMLIYALVEGNVGTAYRHRGEFVWVIALLAGFGVVVVQRFWSRRFGSAIAHDAGRDD